MEVTGQLAALRPCLPVHLAGSLLLSLHLSHPTTTDPHACLSHSRSHPLASAHRPLSLSILLFTLFPSLLILRSICPSLLSFISPLFLSLSLTLAVSLHSFSSSSALESLAFSLSPQQPHSPFKQQKAISLPLSGGWL